MVLEYEGYECLEAATGPEGIEATRREMPDAVLLDINMPEMDGLEALEAIRAKDAHTPVLMISGHGDIPTAVEAIHKGAYDFLEKPLESERVLTALRNAVERKLLREENLRLRHQVEADLRLVGESRALKTVREAIARSAPAQRCCGSGRRGRSSRSAWRRRSASTRASSPPPTRTCRPASEPARSARTCSSASTSCRSPARPCASGARTSPCWWSTSWRTSPGTPATA